MPKILHSLLPKLLHFWLPFTNNDKIIIFWDENLANPTFHAMEVDAGNQEEIQKIYKCGGRRLLEIIDITADVV